MSKINVRKIFDTMLSLLASTLFFFSDSLPDKATYIDLAKQSYQNGFNDFIYTFNGVELLSFLLFWLVGFANNIGIECNLSFAIIVFIFTKVFFGLISKNSWFLYFSYILIVFFIYLQDYWLNQIRASLAIVFIFYLLKGNGIKIIKNNSLIRYSFASLFHLQTIALLPAFTVTLRNFGLFLIFFALVAKPLSDYLFVLFNDESFLVAFTKMSQYGSMSNLYESNALQFSRIILIALLSLSQIYFYKRGSILFNNLACTNAFFAIFFFDYPVIFGRLTSMIVFFEPLFIQSINVRFIKYSYFALLVLNAILKTNHN